MRRLSILAAFIAAPLSAHVTIWPKESPAGAREKYEVRLPNEKDTATVALELHFPDGLKFSAVEQKAGWQSELLRDSSGEVRGVRWTGKLEPKEFTELGLLAINPTKEGEIVFDATQFFADGTRVEWSGPAGSTRPAPRVRLTGTESK